MSNITGRGTLRGTIGSFSDVIDYNNLTNKPEINGTVIEDDHTGRYYGLTESEVIEWIDYQNLPESTKKNGKVYYIRNVGTYVEKTISNVAVASFNDGSQNPLTSLKVEIVPNQEGSGTPSPSNPRPITGYSTLNVIVSPSLDPDEGTTTYIPLGQTVYGGELDVTTGELSVKYIRYDLGDYSWVWITDARLDTGGAFRALPLDMKLSGYILADIYMCYPDTGFTELISRYGSSVDNVMTSNGNAIYVINSAYTNADDFKTAMDGKYMLYELATPVTYQLTPTQVNSILGINNIWTNTGDIIELKYLSPMGLIENQIRTMDEIYGRG